MKKSIKNLIYKSNLFIMLFSLLISALLILIFYLRLSYSSTLEEMKNIQFYWQNTECHMYLCVTRWLKGAPFEQVKESVLLTDAGLNQLTKVSKSPLYPHKIKMEIYRMNDLWELTKETKINPIIQKIDALIVSQEFLQMETTANRNNFKYNQQNYLTNLNFRELAYDYKTKNDGNWDGLTLKSMELLSEINSFYGYTQNYSKKLHNVLTLTKNLIDTANISIFFLILFLVTAQILFGGMFALNISKKVSDPIVASSKKLIDFVGKSLETSDAHIEGNDEIRQLNYCVDTLLHYYHEIAETAKKLSIGDIAEEIVPLSANDVIGTAFHNIVLYLKNLTTGANEILKENYTYRIEEKSEKDILAQTYNKLTVFLSELIQKTKEMTRLESEIKAASRIQNSTLPTRDENIKGYEIAHTLITATEVGGDNYDFRATKNGNWFSIGDVSGHGLEAGIIALIAQSAFNYGVYLFETLVDTDEVPVRMYEYVNKTLFLLNKVRGKSDSFMTMNYFFEKDGVFYGAGAHEIALIYRVETHSVEEIRELSANVLFMGILDNIDAKTSSCSFYLNPEDILFLYTDGLIEAKNKENQQFDLERLKQLLLEYAKLPPEEMKKNIIDDLKKFAQYGDIAANQGAFADDVTLLIIKRINS